MNRAFVEYFRPGEEPSLEVRPGVSKAPGYFAFDGLTCYGHCAAVQPSAHYVPGLPDVEVRADLPGGRIELPFDLTEVTTNLREERYSQRAHHLVDRVTSSRFARSIYYGLRPLLSTGVRKHLQRIRLSGWESIGFPRWPVDVTVDTLMQRTMGLAVQARGGRAVPFIWFWPDGSRCAAIVTHDVEGVEGEAFCDQLMDLDDAFGIKAAFQVVPEVRSSGWEQLAGRLRARGFEVNLHDLNHDGYLFDTRERFVDRARQINSYAHQFGCRGFRSGAMYRQQQWYDAFEFEYDMSVPNVAHLEPQRGGCCTVMPYFVGRILELPVTMAQDYSLFHILNDYSSRLWRQQMDVVAANHGLISMITHPDYLAATSLGRAVYSEALAYLSAWRDRGAWIALPGAVNEWWRARSQMRLVCRAGEWQVVGPAAGRARVAYASLEGDRIVYAFTAPVDHEVSVVG